MSTNIHTNVMRRVRTIHALRPLLATSSLSALALLVAAWGIGRQVWVSQVFANMPSMTDLGAVTRFALAAFMQTEFLVQALTVVTLLASLWLVRDAARSLGAMRIA